MVVFDASQVDQPWKPPERRGATELTEISQPVGGVPTVEPAEGNAAVVKMATVGLVHTAEPTVVLDKGADHGSGRYY